MNIIRFNKPAKISSLIEALQKIKDTDGDLPCIDHEDHAFWKVEVVEPVPYLQYVKIS